MSNKFIKTFESFKMNEAFATPDGKPVSQKDIVNAITFAMSSSRGEFDKFSDQISKMQKDEKTVKTLFDTYRPVSMLAAPAFMWMINKIYNSLVENEYQMFNIQIINRIGGAVDLRDANVAVGQVPAGGSVFVTSGPYKYQNSTGYYYERQNQLEKGKSVDLEIVLTPTHWEMDPKSKDGDKVFGKLIKDKSSFDLYSGYFEGERFFFKLYRFKAPKTTIKPITKEEGSKEDQGEEVKKAA